MFTNLMRCWLQQIRRSQFFGKPRRRRQRPGYGRSETLEQRAVLTAQISTIGTVAVATPSDNTIATARDLGALAATPTTVSDFVGSADTQDYSRFTIARTSDFTLRLSGLTSDADVQLQNAQGQFVASSVRGGNLSEDISRVLDAGTYYVRVYQYSGNTNYDLTLSAVTSTVANDNSTAGARELGAIGVTPTVVSDFVGNSDTQDYSRFTIARTSDFTLRLSGLTSDADVQLQNAQGQFVASSVRGGNLSEVISRVLDAGTYYVRVYQYSGDTNYDLTLSAVASTVANDNSTAGARELGAIGVTPTVVSDFVGNSDTQDYSRFTIARTSDFTLRLSGLTSDADVQLRDAQDRVVASSTRGGNQSEEISRTLEAGTYFVRVYQYSGNTNYGLTLSAVASDNSIATARDLGTIGVTPTTVSDVIGNSDTQDYYRFTISQPGNVTLRSSATTTASVLQLFDGQGRSITDSTGWGFAPGEIRWTLDVGTYFVRVMQVYSSADIRYDLTLSVAASDNFLVTARDLGALGTTSLTVHDFVGSTDTQDYFRFTVPQTRNVSIRQVGASYGADIQLLNAAGQVIANSTWVTTATQGIGRTLEAGTYFVRAFQQYGEVNYDLTISAAEVVVANDNSRATARDLGTLGATPTTVRDFVGSSDTQDYFRFTLTQTSNFRLQLSGLSSDADVQILDAQGRVVASSYRWGALPEEITRTLAAGTYFVRVYQYSGDTNYDLTLSVT